MLFVAIPAAMKELKFAAFAVAAAMRDPDSEHQQPMIRFVWLF